MQIKFVTKNFLSNEGVVALIEKELKSIEKLFAEDTIFDVCLKKSKNKIGHDFFKCDITIKNGKQFIRGFGESLFVSGAIGQAVDSLKRKARKIKTAAFKKRREFQKFLPPSFFEDENENENEFFFERIKEIEAETMTDAEAIAQMELSGHDFFVYKDENGFISIAYAKKPGYGVLVVK